MENGGFRFFGPSEGPEGHNPLKAPPGGAGPERTCEARKWLVATLLLIWPFKRRELNKINYLGIFDFKGSKRMGNGSSPDKDQAEIVSSRAI